MATVNFLYRSSKKESSLTLRLLFRNKDEDHVFSSKTKIIVSALYWKNQHHLKRPRDIEITNLQNKINNDINVLENLTMKAFNNEKIDNINKSWLIELIDNYYNPEKIQVIPNKLVDFIDYYIEVKTKEVGAKSIIKFKAIKRKLAKFQEYRNKTIYIADINESFRNEFAKYYRKLNFSQNTAQKELAFIKTFCTHARYLGIETHPHLDKLKLEKEKTHHIYLTTDELKTIEKLEDLKDYLLNARDWLLISCFTGQRISDFLRFEKKMIRTSKEITLIEFTQQKTGKVMTLPLHPSVLQILNKRNGDFPRKISDQKYNDYIKEVCELAKLNKKIKGGKLQKVSKGIYRKITGNYKKWELVTSHIGRRSFATNNYGKIPTPLLIYATGHSTESMFLNYIGKSDQDNALELAKYFNYE